MEWTIRILPDNEYPRLAEADGPLHGHVIAPGQSRIPVAEVDGRIIAYWPIFSALHAEPLWIDPDFRHHPALALALIRTLMAQLREIEAQYVFAIIGDEANGPLAEKFGLAPIPGVLYGGFVPKEG